VTLATDARQEAPGILCADLADIAVVNYWSLLRRISRSELLVLC
jgi:hypothetical protein